MNDLETTAKKQWCPETRLTRIRLHEGKGRNEGYFTRCVDQRGFVMGVNPDFGKCLGFGCRAYDEQTIGKKSYSFCKKMREE